MDHSEMVEMAREHARQKPFLALASRFNPQRVEGFSKIRVGTDSDGGYIMLNDFKDIDLALSFGVETNADWDLAVVAHGIPIQQYDHSVAASPVSHDLIKFFQTKIVGSPDDAEGITIGKILDDAKIKRDASVILKIDIETWEWPVFEACSVADLSRFSQILVEFHDFSHARDPMWMQRAKRVMDKLSSLFGVYHVHANNWSPMIAVGNVYFPETLEVSFANRARYNFVETDELFPTSLDQANNPLLPDLYLGAFRFPTP